MPKYPSSLRVVTLPLRVVELLSDPFATGFYERPGARHAGDVPAPMPGARDRTLPRYEFDLRATAGSP